MYKVVIVVQRGDGDRDRADSHSTHGLIMLCGNFMLYTDEYNNKLFTVCRESAVGDRDSGYSVPDPRDML